MPIYFIQSSQIEGSHIQIEGPLAHHIRDVLRARVGETLEVVDEYRRRYRVAIEGVTSERIRAEILTVEEPKRLSGLELVLAQAILKRSKMDWLIQKATELGVSKIQPLVTERGVVRPQKDRTIHHRDRWWRIAKEAAQQCGCVRIPDVEIPGDFQDVLDAGTDADLKIILWEKEQDLSLRSAVSGDSPIGSVFLIVGPEGGFSSQEMDLARKKGFRAVSLGDRILRAETAGIAAVSILQYELGDMS